MPFALPILPETVAVPLDDAGMPGVIARVRPVDAEELATWMDKFPPGSHQENLGLVRLVKEQLQSVEGIEVEGGAAFDLKNGLHLKEFMRNRRVVNAIVRAIFERSSLGEDAQKKSDSPSASPPALSGGVLSVVPVQASGETTTTAGSQTPDALPTISGTPST